MRTRAEVAKLPEIAAMRQGVHAAYDRISRARSAERMAALAEPANARRTARATARREAIEAEAEYSQLSRAYAAKVAELRFADEPDGLSELRAAVEALEPAFALEPC